MKFGTVPGIDKPVSRLVHGATPSPDFDEKLVLEAFDAAIESGCNTFDSAHIYYGGRHERTFGRWVRENGIRDKVILLGKCAHHNSDRNRVTPFDIAADLHDSLARLKFDYVDMLVLHRDDQAVPVGPIVDALNEQLRAGKIKAFGASNWTHARIEEANAYAKANGLIPFALSSPQFSLAAQVKEPWTNCETISGPDCAEAREWYRRENMAVFAWSSLAQGFLSGRLTRDNVDEYRASGRGLTLDSYASEENFQRLDRVQEIAKAKNATVAQVALAWVLHQPLNIFAIVGSASRAEFQANLDALEMPLTPAELDYLDLKRESV